MAKKEIKTDLWVARQLDDSKIKYDAQGSDVKEINDALQSASKRGTGNAGYPEYVAVVKDFVIVIEDKADLAKHQKLTDTGIISADQKDIADYAVNLSLIHIFSFPLLQCPAPSAQWSLLSLSPFAELPVSFSASPWQPWHPPTAAVQPVP